MTPAPLLALALAFQPLATRPPRGPAQRAGPSVMYSPTLQSDLAPSFIGSADDEVASCDERCVIALFGTAVTGLSAWEEEARSVKWQGMATLRSALPMLSELQASCICAGAGTALQDVLPRAAGREFWICSAESEEAELEAAFETCQHSEAFTEFYGMDVYVCTRAAVE